MRFFDRLKRLRSAFVMRGGFTMAELLVSISILLLISVSVANDLNRTRNQEELQGSARAFVAMLQDLRTRALAGTGATTCTASGGILYACDYSMTGCVGSCATSTAPYAYGVTLALNATGVTAFVEVEPTYNNRRPADVGDQHEALKRFNFLKGSSSNNVTISRIDNQYFSNVSGAYITFERQSGAMRFDACSIPAPLTVTCSGPGEPSTLTVTLRHAKTTQTKIIRLNGITGKISLD